MDRDDQLADWLVRWEDASPASQAALKDDLARENPDLLPAFEDMLRGLGALDFSSESSAPSSIKRVPEPESLPFVAGRYEALRKHSEGGLGVVYHARDSELGRKVALKCIKAFAAGDSDACRQFLFEAEITGRLDHPSIVPVYGLGRDHAARPFYAMRFIHGDTLGKKIDEFHGPGGADLRFNNVEFRRLLRSFVAVCEAVAYAHSQDVIHRDIKPGNIMIGPYGETLLLDWGLAKLVVPGAAPTSDPEETVDHVPGSSTAGAVSRSSSISGKAKGTPAYMAPEQARGDWKQVGPASDIFSLGATLYVLLTGKRAYTGKSNADVAERARLGDFASPRSVNASVPAALEAVCLKAMAKEPTDRYATALDLARDVERWLADEPVSVWREPFTMRARRWMRRNRPTVTAACAAIGVGIVALVVMLVQQNRANAALEKKHEELKVAKEQVDANFGHARAAMREMAEMALVDPHLRQVSLMQMRLAMLMKVRDFYHELAAQRQDDPDVLAELAFIHSAIAIYADMCEDRKSAQIDFRSALEYFQKLAAKRPDSRPLHVLNLMIGRRLVTLENNLDGAGIGRPGDQLLALRLAGAMAGGEWFDRVGRARVAKLMRADALGILVLEFQDVVRPDLEDDVRVVLASALNDFGRYDLRSGRLADSFRYFEASARLCDRSVDRPGPIADAMDDARIDLANLVQSQVESEGAKGDRVEQQRLATIALAAIDRLPEDRKNHEEVKRLKAKLER